MNPGGRKRSFYFPDWMTREVEAEAIRLDRSVSWILQRAWKVARADIHRAEPRTPGPVRDGSFTPTPTPALTPTPTVLPGTGLTEPAKGPPPLAATAASPER
jgi:uncharacterized small protein (TIGR04563 family)